MHQETASVPLIEFSEEDQERLFESRQTELPSIHLDLSQATTKCEKRALTKHQQALSDFKAAESKREIHILKVTKRGLAQILTKKWMPQKIMYEKQLVDKEAQINALIRTSTNAQEQIAIYSDNQLTASMEELRQALALES